MLKELLNLNQPAVDSNCLMRVASVLVHFPTLYICECEVTDMGRITIWRLWIGLLFGVCGVTIQT